MFIRRERAVGKRPVIVVIAWFCGEDDCSRCPFAYFVVEMIRNVRVVWMDGKSHRRNDF